MAVSGWVVGSALGYSQLLWKKWIPMMSTVPQWTSAEYPITEGISCYTHLYLVAHLSSIYIPLYFLVLYPIQKTQLSSDHLNNQTEKLVFPLWNGLIWWRDGPEITEETERTFRTTFSILPTCRILPKRNGHIEYQRLDTVSTLTGKEGKKRMDW